MADTPKNAGKKSKLSAESKSSAKVGIVVRRGALRRFDKLVRSAADLPVEVTWDRRTADRPAAPGARTVERRQPLPFTWDAADFVVIAPSASNACTLPSANTTRANRRTRRSRNE